MKQMHLICAFFYKESTDVAPLRFKSAMCPRNLFLYKATFTVKYEIIRTAFVVKIWFTEGYYIVETNIYLKKDFCMKCLSYRTL